MCKFSILPSVLLLFSSIASADIAPTPTDPSKKVLEVCYKLENNEFKGPDGITYLLIGASYHSQAGKPSSSEYEEVPINTCISFNSMHAVSKDEWLAQAKNSVELSTDNDAMLPFRDLIWVTKGGGNESRTIYFKISGVKDNKLVIYKSKYIDEFSNGQPAKTVELEAP